MITQCAVRTPEGIAPVEAPATVSQQQDACLAHGLEWTEAEAGFLTASGVFLALDEAAVHAVECGQVKTIATPPYLSWSDLS